MRTPPSELYVVDDYFNGRCIQQTTITDPDIATDELDRIENAGRRGVLHVYRLTQTVDQSNRNSSCPIDQPIGVFTAYVCAGVMLAGLFMIGVLF